MIGMKSVSGGVNMVYLGLYLIVLGVVAVIVGPRLVVTAPQVGLLVVGSGWLMLIVGAIMGLVGKIRCLSVPDAVQTWGVIYTAVLCDVLVLLIGVADNLVVLPTIVRIAHGCLALLAFVLLVIFLKRVAVHIKDLQSQDRARSLLNLSIMTPIVIAACWVVPLLAIVALILLLVMLFIYIRLLLSLRVSLRRRMSRR